MNSRAKILIQAIGNPLRSDDAVGPMLIELLSPYSVSGNIKPLDLEWVYQLQIENAEQWRHYESVIVIDADVRANEPFTWREIMTTVIKDEEILCSHQQSPEVVFQLMHQFFENTNTPLRTRVFVLGLQAELFDIGERLSAKSQIALNEAEKFMVQEINRLQYNNTERR